MGEGPVPSLKRPRPEPVKAQAVAFLLLIMSVTEMGLILRKLSGGAARYERAMDFSNEGLRD